MTVQEKTLIEDQISQLKTQRDSAKGTRCEVYSRVVGYLRPVMMWNKGKKEEFALRKNIKMSCGCDR
ncbi:MAG: anaerobic ribonucleoside-triphosphate reductase [Elusimicrobiota bacterium]|jgi:anaerobic ribonucleoside-triphosphate reductase|nr:anaerobic ribonucleoside-triphosphate reductase [Elusimicrobiota bacterium]